MFVVIDKSGKTDSTLERGEDWFKRKIPLLENAFSKDIRNKMHGEITKKVTKIGVFELCSNDVSF